MNIRTRLINNMPSGAEMTKQVNFGTALGLTNTAKTGQKAVVEALGDKFTLRGQWFQQSNKYGIRIKMARPNDLVAEVKTQADWLKLHETGGDKTPRSGGSIAVPTAEVRRNKRMIIPKGQRPNALRDKRTFILMTKNGRVLFQRKGKGKNSKIVALYNLEPRVHIKKTSTFYEPIEKVVKSDLKNNIREGIMKAFRTGGSLRGRIGTYGPR
jgi:hypothetical protein